MLIVAKGEALERHAGDHGCGKDEDGGEAGREGGYGGAGAEADHAPARSEEGGAGEQAPVQARPVW